MSTDNLKNISFLAAHFASALERIHAKVVPVGGMEEVEVIYHKSGGGMEDVLNTVATIGTVSAAGIQSRSTSSLYQVWTQGALGVAENGAIWLQHPAVINSLDPFTCEHLVIVLEAKDLVADMHQARARTGISKEKYGVFPAGPSRAADIKNSLFIGLHLAQNIIVYLVDKEYKTALPSFCGPGCDCW
jgi:L-lactate dehydrogenase complex protein LldG